MAPRPGLPYNPFVFSNERLGMRWVVPVVLLLVAFIHVLPLMALYGIPVQEPNLAVLLRHRAVLFGLLAAFLAFAAIHPPLHRLALVAGWVSVVSFLVLAHLEGPVNAALTTVVRADALALGLPVLGTAVHVWRPPPA